MVAGVIMARAFRDTAAWVVELVDVQPESRVLEVGFGPGVGVQYAAHAAVRGFVAGVDCSQTMVKQASRRNAAAIAQGRVGLQRGMADSLPHEDACFDVAFAVNTVHVWPDSELGLHEMRRVLKPGGMVAVGLSPAPASSFAARSGVAAGETLAAMLAEAAFDQVTVRQGPAGSCALAIKR